MTNTTQRARPTRLRPIVVRYVPAPSFDADAFAATARRLGWAEWGRPWATPASTSDVDALDRACRAATAFRWSNR